MKSCIYEGWVRHRRFAPLLHSFRYRIFMMMLDLDEINLVFKDRWLWSNERRAIASFLRRDHFGDPARSLSDSVRDFVEAQGKSRPAGPIRVLTNLRYFGYVFNPVSFYYCYDQADETVSYIVAEVNNTPWGERHCYLLPSQSTDADREQQKTEKRFHVSPFMPMEVQYLWRVTRPAQRLLVHIENHKRNSESGSSSFFDVTMHLKRKEISGKTLATVLLRYPLMTARITAAIYWQALRLWLKKCPFYPHPKQNRKLTTEVL
jgi:DUF1365 family protein